MAQGEFNKTALFLLFLPWAISFVGIVRIVFLSTPPSPEPATATLQRDIDVGKKLKYLLF